MAWGTVVGTARLVLADLEDHSFWKGALSLRLDDGVVTVADRMVAGNGLFVFPAADAETLADGGLVVLGLLAVTIGDLAFTGCAFAADEGFVLCTVAALLVN